MQTTMSWLMLRSIELGEYISGTNKMTILLDTLGGEDRRKCLMISRTHVFNNVEAWFNSTSSVMGLIRLKFSLVCFKPVFTPSAVVVAELFIPVTETNGSLCSQRKSSTWLYI